MPKARKWKIWNLATPTKDTLRSLWSGTRHRQCPVSPTCSWRNQWDPLFAWNVARSLSCFNELSSTWLKGSDSYGVSPTKTGEGSVCRWGHLAASWQFWFWQQFVHRQDALRLAMNASQDPVSGISKLRVMMSLVWLCVYCLTVAKSMVTYRLSPTSLGNSGRRHMMMVRVPFAHVTAQEFHIL